MQLLLGDRVMIKQHVQGAVHMVESNGGWNTLGLNGFLEILLLRYAERVGLVLQAASPPLRSQGSGPG